MRILSTCVATTVSLTLVLACGSSEGDKNAFNGVNPPPGPNIDPSNGAAGGSSTPGGDKAGGVTPLGPGGLEGIRNSACAGWTAEPESLPAILQFVVDVSGSMTERAPGSRSSKWSVTHQALNDSIDALPGSTSVGMLLYPNRDTGDNEGPPVDPSRCVAVNQLLPVAALAANGSPHRDAVEDLLDRANVGGGTPTYDAYNAGLTAFEASVTSGNRFMVLITDGQPTYGQGCFGTGHDNPEWEGYHRIPTDPIVELVKGARSRGIRTFIIGSPGSERNRRTDEDLRPWLSAAAQAGGTGTAGCSDTGPNFCHFDMSTETDFAEGLKNALGIIAGQVVQCSYEMPTPPEGQTIDPDKVAVVHIPAGGEDNAEIINQKAGGGCTEGWQFSSDGKQVLLCEATCNRVKADPAARLELLFGCAADQVVGVPK